MTVVDIVFQCHMTPTERQMIALDLLREVYGVRKISFEETKGTIRIEYDISRLTPADIAALVHGAGIDADAEVLI
jgi:hypothetical protein